MEMKHQLRQTQKQTLIMTQKLRQALKLLTLPTLELRQELKTELAANPLLEEIEDLTEVPDTQIESTEPAEPEGESDFGEDMDWESFLQDASDTGTAPAPERPDEEFQRVNVSTQSLTEILREQLCLKDLSAEDEVVMDFILGSLDERGYLTLDASEVATHLASEPERVGRMLRMLQECEPLGVGARDLRECLLIQARSVHGDDSLPALILAEHWDALTHRRLTDISRALHIPLTEVQDALDQIAALNPSPGGQVEGNDARYVYPDLVVERVGEDYVVFLNDRNVPRVRINRAYEHVLLHQTAANQEARDFVKSKLKSARWIVQTIEQRRRTMVKVMTKIVEKQRGFFDHGVVHLKPLTLQDVAREIGMHESTVSRVTNSKYVQTPRGVFELKFFFSSGLGTAEGDDISSKAAKERIHRLIEEEDKQHPLSDQRIADTLRAEGVDIARRTVAKYREQLGVPSARLRRRH